jgi:hypothetical protein
MARGCGWPGSSWSRSARTAEQIGFIAAGGKISGHIDGVITGAL